MKNKTDIIEQRRIGLQAELDAQKTQAERNRLGQFATPSGLAEDVLAFAQTLVSKSEQVRFLDPAIGTGSFYAALCKVFPKGRIGSAVGFEIDRHYGEPAARLWKHANLKIHLADFTHAKPQRRFNLVICNPPYVRHHHLENGEKQHLHVATMQASGMKLSGLAGLYCHFLGLSHAWMEDGAIAGWLIPSEFMDVNYGRALKHYLLHRVTLLRVHRFDPNDVQFADALVSSAVVWIRNAPPPPNHRVSFTFGGSLAQPQLSREISTASLAREPKWTRFPRNGVRLNNEGPVLSDFFQIKRGLATGDNSYFIVSEDELSARNLPRELFIPILPSPRYLPQNEIVADNQRNPKVDRRLFLLDTRLSEGEIKRRYPTLYEYLGEGKRRKLHERYLCQHRSPWYAQEDRPPAPIVCTYLGRSDREGKKPFRFILNASRATVANVYLAMYPTERLARAMERDNNLIRMVWNALNHLAPERVLGEGRVYGGGLHKLEPKELGNVPVPEIASLLPSKDKLTHKQSELFVNSQAL